MYGDRLGAWIEKELSLTFDRTVAMAVAAEWTAGGSAFSKIGVRPVQYNADRLPSATVMGGVGWERLLNGAWESVQDKSGAALWRADVVPDQPHDDLVAHKRSLVHRLLCLPQQARAAVRREGIPCRTTSDALAFGRSSVQSRQGSIWRRRMKLPGCFCLLETLLDW